MGTENRVHREIRDAGVGNALFLTLDADNSPYYMKPTEHVIVAITALADAAAIIYLPSVAEAAGGFYSIYAPTGATAGDISLYTRESGAEYTGGGDDGDLDADADYVVVYSNGVSWVTIKDGVA